LREHRYKKDSLIQIVRLHEDITSSAILQRDRRLKRELQRGEREKKKSTIEKTKKWQGKRFRRQFAQNLRRKAGG
jgi:hypothetical protein